MIPENASIRDASVKLSKSPRKRSYCALPAAWVAEIMWECIPPASERSCKGQHKHKLPLWNNPEYENSLPLLSAACQQSRLLSQNAQARLICSPLETRVVPLFPITTWPVEVGQAKRRKNFKFWNDAFKKSAFCLDLPWLSLDKKDNHVITARQGGYFGYRFTHPECLGSWLLFIYPRQNKSLS